MMVMKGRDEKVGNHVVLTKDEENVAVTLC
jgi:hypothetical protein